MLWVSTLVRTIFEQPDAASVHAQHSQVVQALQAKLPEAAAHLDQARDDILAFAIYRQVARGSLRRLTPGNDKKHRGRALATRQRLGHLHLEPEHRYYRLPFSPGMNTPPSIWKPAGRRACRPAATMPPRMSHPRAVNGSRLTRV